MKGRRSKGGPSLESLARAIRRLRTRVAELEETVEMLECDSHDHGFEESDESAAFRPQEERR